MPGGDAEKILPEVPAEPRGDPAEPAHRALRHAVAPPQLVAREPAVGLRRGCGGEQFRGRGREDPPAAAPAAGRLRVRPLLMSPSPCPLPPLPPVLRPVAGPAMPP